MPVLLKPHLVGLSLGGSLILTLLEKHADLVDKVIVDGAAHQPIKGSRVIIAMVYLMSLLKDTTFIAKFMAKMMQENGVSKEECQLFVADLQRTTKKSFRRAMSQANMLKVNATFDNPVFLSQAKKNLKQFINLIRCWRIKIHNPTAPIIQEGPMRGCSVILQAIFNW